MRYVSPMVAKLGSLANQQAPGGGKLASESARQRRVAELLRVVGHAMTELADEFERDVVPQDRPSRRRCRTVAVPEAVTDLDVQAARLALRKAGL